MSFNRKEQERKDKEHEEALKKSRDKSNTSIRRIDELSEKIRENIEKAGQNDQNTAGGASTPPQG